MRIRTVARLAPAALAALGGVALAQDPAPAESELDAAVEETVAATPAHEITVTATRTSRDPFDVPRTVTIVGADDIAQSGSFVAFRALNRRNAGIWYDERTSTTVDPMIRGFAGFNLLALVDGNTLTTLWGEGGFGADDMYGKLDPEMIERIEVVHGPSSALYGSNALGAVMNVITRTSRYDYTNEGVVNGWRVKGSLGSNANAGSLRLESHGATPELKWMLGASARDWDDIEGGSGQGDLVPTDGRERNWDFSGEYRVGDAQELRLTIQDVDRKDIKRYYRPTQNNRNEREAIALFFEDEGGNDLFDTMDVRGYWQKKRDTRWFEDTGAKGIATTETWQTGLTGTRDLGGGHVLTTGFQFERDEGDSPDDEQFTYVMPRPKRRDAPLSTWLDYGVFAQDEWAIDDDWSVIASARYDYMDFSTRVDRYYVPPVGNPQDDDIDDTQDAWTGGLGAMYKATSEVHVWGNWARGFRQNAPNFGIRQLGDGVLIPNELLDPTESDNFEVGVKGRWPGLRFDVAYYHTLIDNWQGDLAPTSYKGSTWFDFNRNGVRDANESYVKQIEGSDAHVRGVEANVSLQPHAYWDDVSPVWSVWGSFAWNRGSSDPTSENPQSEPLRHTQPMRAIVGLRWDDVYDPKSGRYVELMADMVDRYDNIPSNRQLTDLAWRRDAQDGTSPLLRSYVGTPGYTIFHLYAGMNLEENVRVELGVENLFDKKYRVAHSRMDAPGINVVASLEILF